MSVYTILICSPQDRTHLLQGNFFFQNGWPYKRGRLLGLDYNISFTAARRDLYKLWSNFFTEYFKTREDLILGF